MQPDWWHDVITTVQNDRMLSHFGPRVRSFIRTTRVITESLRVTGVIRSIRLGMMVTGRILTIGAVGGPVGEAIAAAAIAIAAIVGTLKWVVNSFADFFYKDYMDSIRTGASIGGLRAFRTSFRYCLVDPYFYVQYSIV